MKSNQGIANIAIVVVMLLLLVAGAGIILWQTTRLPVAGPQSTAPEPGPEAPQTKSLDEQQCDIGETPQCTKLALERADIGYCDKALTDVYEGGIDVNPTKGRRYCILRFVWENRDINICHKYLPGDKVCEHRATRPTNN